MSADPIALATRATRATRAGWWLAVLLLLAACSTTPPTTVLQLQAIDGSGVSGTVSLAAAGAQRTLVLVEVDPAGHLNMPAHIHPGNCDELVPQPRYPLENVVDGMSSTEVPAPLDELLRGDVALNLHRSDVEMQIYTACVDLR